MRGFGTLLHWLTFQVPITHLISHLSCNVSTHNCIRPNKQLNILRLIIIKSPYFLKNLVGSQRVPGYYEFSKQSYLPWIEKIHFRQESAWIGFRKGSQLGVSTLHPALNGYFVKMTLFHKLRTFRFRQCGLKSTPVLEKKWNLNDLWIPPFLRNICFLLMKALLSCGPVPNISKGESAI